jgi:hypothetical protein
MPFTGFSVGQPQPNPPVSMAAMSSRLLFRIQPHSGLTRFIPRSIVELCENLTRTLQSWCSR